MSFWKYKTLKDMLKDNNKQLIRYNEGIYSDTGIEKVFDFSEKHGGAIDSHLYYNNYYVIDKRKEVKDYE